MQFTTKPDIQNPIIIAWFGFESQGQLYNVC